MDALCTFLTGAGDDTTTRGDWTTDGEDLDWDDITLGTLDSWFVHKGLGVCMAEEQANRSLKETAWSESFERNPPLQPSSTQRRINTKSTKELVPPKNSNKSTDDMLACSMERPVELVLPPSIALVEPPKVDRTKLRFMPSYPEKSVHEWKQDICNVPKGLFWSEELNKSPFSVSTISNSRKHGSTSSPNSLRKMVLDKDMLGMRSVPSKSSKSRDSSLHSERHSRSHHTPRLATPPSRHKSSGRGQVRPASRDRFASRSRLGFEGELLHGSLSPSHGRYYYDGPYYHTSQKKNISRRSASTSRGRHGYESRNPSPHHRSRRNLSIRDEFYPY